ncbi:MAG TPA: hypothetical protein VHG29_13695 [Novosphingobium sp.]|nr:hypothetical protein [Novosphingobium sp.]
MRMPLFLAAAASVTLAAAPALAQTTTSSIPARDRIGQILGTIFGDRSSANTSLEAQWAAGQTPLTNQHGQFDSRVDADVRSGALNQLTATRLKADYAALVELEARYGADGRFSTQERADLADRYGALTQVLTDRGYAESTISSRTEVADGRAEFGRRVDSAVAARRITRTAGTRLKADYAAAVQVEAGYLRDGVISEFERDDLDARLDALDARLGDTNYVATPVTARTRLDAIARAVPTSGLSTAAQAQLRVEHGDLARLEAAFARLTVSADERAYLDRRLAELEIRARITR